MKWSIILISFILFFPMLVHSGPIAELTAEKLYAEFEKNEIAAEALYKGKEIIVTGKIADVKKNIAGQPIVNLDAGSLKFIGCRFPDNKIDQLINLKKGETARFSCTVDYKIITTINLSNCSIR